MQGGKVKWFDSVKGYGFIVSNDGKKQDLFAHYSDIQGDGYRNLKAGQDVQFQFMDGPKGPQALDIVLNFSSASAH